MAQIIQPEPLPITPPRSAQPSPEADQRPAYWHDAIAGHPASGAVVLVGKERTVATASGAFTIRVATAGSYVVSATSGGGTAKRTVRVC